MEQLDIKSLYEEELKEKMISLGEKPFKGKQLYQWLHQKAAGSYEEMTNLSEGLRKKLTEAWQFRMHFFPGWLSDGMPFLCIYDRWTDQKPSAVRDAGSGLPDPGTDRGACVECGCDGNRRAVG